MRDRQIKTDPFEFLSMKEVKIHKKINEHSYALISGYIEKDKEESYTKMGLDDTQMKIDLLDENGGASTLFCGVVVSVVIQVEGQLNMMTIEMKSNSYLMDLGVHARLFQDVDMTYTKVLGVIGEGYQGSSFLLESKLDGPIGELIVQYNETDWEFVRRVASRLHSYLVPEDCLGGFKCYVDITGVDVEVELEEGAYRIEKQVHNYRQKSSGGLDQIIEMDEVYLVFDHREFFHMGDKISFKGDTFAIAEMKSEYKGQEMVHTYCCKPQNGFQTTQTYNEAITGVSLEAVVKDVQADQVTLEVSVDEMSPKDPKLLFTYATVYSSPDGTGWYCMPEIDDTVRLYFPTNKEEECYVISSVQKESDSRSDPDKKSIKNMHGKELLFTPDSLILTNNNGMSISILDEEGIVIESDKAVIIEAHAEVEISSIDATLTMMASELVDIKQGGTGIVIDDNVQFMGGMVKME